MKSQSIIKVYIKRPYSRSGNSYKDVLALLIDSIWFGQSVEETDLGIDWHID